MIVFALNLNERKNVVEFGLSFDEKCSASGSLNLKLILLESEWFTVM